MDPQQPDSGDSQPAPSVATAPAFVEQTPVDANSSAALREDQIQNAIAFLSHPKVRGSTEAAKRAFLDKKGLTPAEIDEAFKRVPPEAAAPAAAPAATGSTPTVGANNLVTYTQQQQPQQPQQAPGLHPQHAPQGVSQALVPAPQVMQRPPVHWSQVVLGLGVAAAGLYGVHQLLAPRLSAWSQQLFSARKAAAEAEEARREALMTALERLTEGQTRLQESLEGLTAAVKQQQQQQVGFGDSQADYMAGASPSFANRPHYHQDHHKQHQHQQHHHHHQQQQQYGGYGSSYVAGGQQQASGAGDTYASSSRAAAVRGGSSWDPYAPDSSYRAQSDGRPGSAASPGGVTPGPTAGPSGFHGSSAYGFEVTPPPLGSSHRAPQPPAQYQQQRGEQQFGGSSSTNPNAGDPGYARRAGAYANAAGPEAPSSTRPGANGEPARPDEAPRSAAFHEVMAMVQAGITPPNVRTDIDDSPPDPSRPLSAPQLPPRAKPWEASTVSSNGFGTPGAAYSSNAVVADGPSGFGVRGYGGNAAAAATGAAASPGATPTSAPHSGSSRGPAAATGGPGGLGDDGYTVSSSSHFEAPSHRSGAGYDLSQLLGPDTARDAPWRPPPPPAATVQRPGSSGSSSNKQQAGLTATDSAPPAPPAQLHSQGVEAAAAVSLPAAASAPPAATAADLVAPEPLPAGAASQGAGEGSAGVAAPEVAAVEAGA